MFVTDVQELLKKVVIEVEHDDELSVMRITRCRPTTSISSDSQLRLTSSSRSSPPPLVDSMPSSRTAPTFSKHPSE